MGSIREYANILSSKNKVKPTTGKALMTEFGVTGVKHFGRYVHEEILPELVGQRGMLTYREMRDNDSTIGGAMYAIESLVRNVKYNVEAASKREEDELAAEFLESCLSDMENTFSDTISDILTFLTFGFCVMEMTFKIRRGHNHDVRLNSKYDDGRFGWSSWSIRAQETLHGWEWDDSNRVVEMLQLAPPDYALRRIPLDKCLLFRPKANKNNPEGRSILRNCYRPWFYKKNFQEIEGIGAEKDLNGVPVLYLPAEILRAGSDPGNSDPNLVLAYNEYSKLVSEIRRNERTGILLPSDTDEQGRQLYKIELLGNNSTRRQFDTDAIIKRYDKDIAMSLIADFLLLGNNSQGSFALSSDKTNMFKTSLNVILQSICDEINNKAIPMLFRMNNFNIKNYPKLTHGNVDDAGIKELAMYIKSLTDAGALNVKDDTRLEDALRAKGGLPSRPDKEIMPEMSISTSNESREETVNE